MTILFECSHLVKPARPFGVGLLRSLPVARASHTSADEAWFADQCGNRNFYRLLDEMAAESAAVESYCRGVLPV